MKRFIMPFKVFKKGFLREKKTFSLDFLATIVTKCGQD